MSAYNFVHNGSNFTKNFLFNAQKIAFVNTVHMLSLSLSIPEIFALKLEICHKSHRFLHVFCSPNFKGAVPPKVVLVLTPHLETRQVPKFRRATPSNSEVIMAHLFHFKPIFDPPLKKVVRGAAIPDGGWASKTWSFCSACKNLGAQHPLQAEIWSSK